MKIRTLCSVALVALTAASLVGGSKASAAPADTTTNLTNDGVVNVIEGTIDTTPGVTDPEVPGTKLPENPGVKPNPSTPGPLMITHVSKLDFGEIKTSNKAVSSYAKAIDFGGSIGERGALVQFGDIRTKANGYTITAQLSDQFVGTKGGKLGGATIKFTNPLLETETGSTGVKPSGLNTEVTLSEGAAGAPGAAQTVVTASGTEGKGEWVLEFGQSSTFTGTGGTADTADKSVQLNVPSYTAQSMAEDTYTAKITWSIVAAP